MIDIERLGVLLDRGADVQAASRQALDDLVEAQRALRQHDAGAAERAALDRRRARTGAPPRTDDDDATRAALQARIERRAGAQGELSRRASLWADYCERLLQVAKKHGVKL